VRRGTARALGFANDELDVDEDDIWLNQAVTQTPTHLAAHSAWQTQPQPPSLPAPADVNVGGVGGDRKSAGAGAVKDAEASGEPHGIAGIEEKFEALHDIEAMEDIEARAFRSHRTHSALPGENAGGGGGIGGGEVAEERGRVFTSGVSEGHESQDAGEVMGTWGSSYEE
jgi:hypothetical protein